MKKHTPGPWIAPAEQVNLVCRKADYESQQIGALANGFQCSVSLKQGEAQAAANARLIAAAPDLLEACQIALQYLEDFGIEKTEYVWAPLLKAIAKAEGGAK